MAALALVAAAAFAHEGVTDETVKARMAAMGDISACMKLLGDMARGKTRFEPEAANQAVVAIAQRAVEVPALFEPRADDPGSDASPAIWDNFEDFRDQARLLERTAQGVAGTVAVPGDLDGVLGALGDSCKSCHRQYRE